MGTGISNRLLLAAAILICVGCGASKSARTVGSPVHSRAPAAGGHSGGAGAARGGFRWFVARPTPPSWRAVRISSGARMAYPPSWTPRHGDPGTATAALLSRDRSFIGYLNITPRQGKETLAGWSSFRLDHNREEGDHDVRRLVAAAGLRFLTGHGSCVKDSYTTASGHHYLELACIVAGQKATSVIVGAAPPASWPHQVAAIERAIEGVET